jgi:hypothetical protein
VKAVAHVPGVVALLPEDRHPARSEHLDLLDFVQHVLLERLTVDFALFEHLLHERVELVGRRGGWLSRRRLRQHECGECQAEQGYEREQQVRAY